MSHPPAGQARPRAAGRVLLPLLIGVGLCVVFGALRWSYRPPLGDGLDGAYYFQIARQVALGHGLDTTYSVFHMGLSPLPQRATSYPLTPLAIGYLARFMPLEQAAVWLPGVAYVASIVLCFAFLRWLTARSLPRVPASARLTLSTLISVWFGLIPVYVWTSARPYTEALANLLLLTSLYCFGSCSGAHFASRSKRAAAFFGVGMLTGLCYLARFQWLVVAVAFVLSRLLARDRRAWRDAVCIALGFVPCFAWQAWRQLSLPHGELYALLDFAMYRQDPNLPRFVYDLQFDSRIAWFLDKLAGVRVSLDPNNDESYFVQLSYLVWLVPCGLFWFTLRQGLRLKKQGLRALRVAGLRRPRHAALLASAWVGVLAVAPLHTVHSLHWRTWSFAWRHGMPLLYLIIPIVIWLWSLNSAWLRALVAIVLSLSIVVCARKTQEVLARHVPTQILEGYAEVAQYLDDVAPTGGTLGMEHQGLAVFSAQPLYWLACWSPPAFASTLLRDLPIDRIVLRSGEYRCPSLAQIRSRLRLERSFNRHYPMAVYRIDR